MSSKKSAKEASRSSMSNASSDKKKSNQLQAYESYFNSSIETKHLKQLSDQGVGGGITQQQPPQKIKLSSIQTNSKRAGEIKTVMKIRQPNSSEIEV